MVLELGGNTAVAMDKMEHMLGLMNKADRVTPSIPGLGDFFALGPGTCRPCRSTAGFFHHLEYADSLGFSKIHSIDRALPPNYPGRPDLIIRVLDPNNPTKSLLKQVELKSIRATNRLGGKALAQLTKNLEKAAERATATAAVAGKPSAAELLGEMPIYVFREADSPAIRAQLLAKLTGNPDYSALAPQIVAPNSPYLKFLGLPPF